MRNGSPESSRFYLGVDAGATKTHALIADQAGHVLGLGHAGPGNWESVGLDGAYRAYLQALQDALSQAQLRVQDLCAAGYGLAGLDWPSDEERLTPVIEKLAVPGPRMLVNDTFIALQAGARRGHGVAIIAGTGTTVAGRNRSGEQFRTFGLGMMWGDVGGASDLVRLALRAIALAHIGRSKPTQLTDRFLAHYQVQSAAQLIEGLTRNQLPYPNGSLAPLVFAAADAGDAAAQGIIHYAGSELGKNAVAVARRLDMLHESFELVLAGGVFRSRSQLLFDSLIRTVRTHAPQAEPVALETLPVAGGVLLAMEATGNPIAPEVRHRLMQEASAFG